MESKKTFRGIARNVNWRKEKEYFDVLTFRIERRDNEGNIIDYVPVTMEGYIKGNLADGDEVEVVGKIDSDGLLNAETIYNIRTKAYIRTKKIDLDLLKTGSDLLIIFSIFGSLFMIFLVFAGITGERGTGPFTRFAMFFFTLAIISFVVIFIVLVLKIKKITKKNNNMER